MDSREERYRRALEEFRDASDAYHASGAPAQGPVADRYNAAAAAAREATWERRKAGGTDDRE